MAVSPRVGAFVGLFAWALNVPAVATGFSIETVAFTGAPAPVGEPGEFGGFATPSISAQGQVVFLAGFGLSRGGSTDGFFAGGPGDLRLVAAENAAAPGAGDAAFESFDRPVIDDAGRVAFHAELVGPGVRVPNDAGVWKEAPGGLALVAREGDAVPDVPGGKFVSLEDPVLSPTGAVAFRARIEDPAGTSGFSNGYWSDRSGALRRVYLTGDPAPGAVGEQFIGFFLPSINGVGDLMFPATSRPASETVGGTRGIWIEDNNELRRVMSAGEAAPGTGGLTFEGLSSGFPSYNAAGDVIFQGFVQGPGVTSDNSRGLWIGNADGINLLARGGDPAPGAPGLALDTPNEYVLNDLGDTATRWTLAGPGQVEGVDSGIWRTEGPGGPTSLVARTGTPAPGTDGAAFRELFSPMLNNRGTLVFRGILEGPGVTGLNNQGLWVANAADNVQLLLRSGDEIDVDPDPNITELRTILGISTLFSTGIGNGRPNSLNHADQLAFELRFVGGDEGIFIATVPEPTTCLVLLFGSCAALRRRSA